MPRMPRQQRSQPITRSRGATARQGGGISATQFMLFTTLFGSLFILVNVYHLMPEKGLDEPLPRLQPLFNEVADIAVPIKTTTTNDQTNGASKVEYHTVFSTGCSKKQNFQSYVFFFHAMKSGQPGRVTRIAACKTEDDKNALIAHHKEFIRPMSSQFHLHITPDFSGVKPGRTFHYFNKPFSTHHWMENALGYNPQHKNIGDNMHDDTIVILCDPDQIIMRPFTNNVFPNETELWTRRTTHPIVNQVTHGKPMGQLYGFFDQWKTKTNITRYVPKEELPSFVETMSTAEMRENYSVGPPYIATAFDFYKIVTRWKDFVPLVHDDYPHLLAEMFAYCLAAAHLRLPHQVARSFMVSDVGAFSLEGWDLIKDYSKRDVCTPGNIPSDRLPHVLHYCQRYILGKFVIGKHRIPETFLSCDDPLLTEPPEDLGEKFNFAIEPDQVVDKKISIKPPVVKNHAFMLCHLIPYLNEVATYWKDNHCPGKTPNKQKTLVYFESMDVDPKFFQEN